MSEEVQQEAPQEKVEQAKEAMIPESEVLGLKSKVEELLGKLKKKEEEAYIAQEEAQKVMTEKAHEQGDYKSLYEAQLQAAEKAKEDFSVFKSAVQKKEEEYLLSQAVGKVTTSLFGEAADIFAPAIQSRLKVVELDGQKSVAVLGQDGKVSADTLDAFQQSIKEDSRFSQFMVASQASGGGSTGSSVTGSVSSWHGKSASEKIGIGLGGKK